MNRASERGFTLLEMVCVLALIAMMAAVLLPFVPPVAAIAALGMKTSFKALFAVGWRPVGLMIAETLWIAVLVLFAVKVII